jgi:outer membrane murein-binding lipoprotein Lpp
MRRTLTLALLATATLLAGCESTYYAAMEKAGFAKCDILASRVVSARDAQLEDSEAAARAVRSRIAEANRFIADLERNGG